MKNEMMIAAFALAIGACTSAPPATPEAQGRKLADQMKAAMGGKAWDRQSTFHKSGTAERGGQHVAWEAWGDMRNLKTASLQSVGGPRFGGGYDGVVSWGMGPDGKVRSSSSPEAVANGKFGAYMSVSGWFFPDRFPATFVFKGKRSANGADYDIVEVTPQGAPYPVQLWLDPRTHVLKRTSASNGKESFYADALRYETVDGVKIDFRNDHYDDGKLEAQTVEHFEFTPVPAERFSPPR
jgi:hypothetical protein